LRTARPGFLPLLIGLHWPSLPWGDDRLASGAASFGVGGGAVSPTGTDEYRVEAEVTPEAVAAAQTRDTPAAREALRTIFAAASKEIAPVALPPEVRDADAVLDREIGLAADGPDAAPGDDREPFDPDKAYRSAQAMLPSYSGGFADGLLAPLRTLSF